MGKVIASPSQRWPGTVTLQSPLYLPQAAAWEAALGVVEDLPARVTHRTYLAALLPAVYACIERFDLAGWQASSPDQFPPTDEGVELAAWLVKEVAVVYAESVAPPPKASTPTPMPTPSESMAMAESPSAAPSSAS
ncbi:MAG: hypothetical protein KF821_09010 [Anaerolineales bacterium]|nr:hypothetical protein [Anaerolineales bacterium]